VQSELLYLPIKSQAYNTTEHKPSRAFEFCAA